MAVKDNIQAQLLKEMAPPARYCRYTAGHYSAETGTIRVMHDDSVDKATEADIISNVGRALHDLQQRAEAHPNWDTTYHRATTRVLLQPQESAKLWEKVMRIHYIAPQEPRRTLCGLRLGTKLNMITVGW